MSSQHFLYVSDPEKNNNSIAAKFHLWPQCQLVGADFDLGRSFMPSPISRSFISWSISADETFVVILFFSGWWM